jgi:hypothetical protein
VSWPLIARLLSATSSASAADPLTSAAYAGKVRIPLPNYQLKTDLSDMFLDDIKRCRRETCRQQTTGYCNYFLSV